MLSRFASTIDLREGTERRERFTIGALTRTAFSVTSLGLTAYATVGLYNHTRKSWNKFPLYMRRFLERPLPWERTAENMQAKFTAQSVYRKPQSILQMADKYEQPSRQAARESINRGAMMEIYDLEDYLGQSNTTRIYLQRARLDTFNSKDLVTGGSVDDLVWAYPDAASRYRRNLRKYKGLYDRIDPQVREEAAATYTVGEHLSATGQLESRRNIRNELVDHLHREALKVHGRQYVPVSFDFSEVRYNPIQIGQGWGMTRRDSFSLRKLLVDAERGGVLSWEDRKLYSANPQYMHLNIARTENAVGRVYKKLNSELATRAQAMLAPNSNTPLDQLYKVEPQIVNYGDGNLAVRLLLRLKDEGGDTWSTEEVVMPLGNKGNIQFGMSSHRYVGPLYKRTGSTEYLNPATQLANEVERQAGNIVNDMAMGRPGKSGWRNAVRSVMDRRVTMAQGDLMDRGVMLTIRDEDTMRLSPAYRWAEGEKSQLRKELDRLRGDLRSLRYTANTDKINSVRERIELVRTQLGAGYSITDQMREFHRRMGRMIDEEGSPIPYYWERGATHAGSFRYTSIFGYSPFALEANPQASLYQYYNVYEFAPSIRTSYPIKYGGRPILPEANYMPARVAFAGNLFPFSESEVWARPGFYERITKGRARGTGEPSAIRIPMEAGKFTVDTGQTELANLLGEIRPADRLLDADKIHGIVSARDVRLQPNTLLAVTSEGRRIRSGKFASIVTDIAVDPDTQELVLKMERVGAPTSRLRSLLGARGGMRPAAISIKSTSMGINRPLDYIIKGSIGKRINYRMLEVGIVADAIEEVRQENIGLLKVMQDVTGRRADKGRASMRYRFNVAKLRGAASKLGGRYDNGSQTIHLPGVFSMKGMYNHLSTMRPEVTDQVLSVLGRTYRPDDPTFREVSRLWDIHGERWARWMKAPPELIERMRPRIGGPARLGLVDTTEGRILTTTALDLAGLMRQSHAEMVSTFGLKTGPDAGIPFRYTELPLLLHRYMKAPEPIRAPLMGAVGRYVSYLTSQLGGEEAGEEYVNILRQINMMEVPAGERAIRMGTSEYEEFMRLTRATRISGGDLARETIYIIDGEPIFGPESATKVQLARAAGKVVDELPAYKLRKADLGIFDPARHYMGTWVQIPWELDVTYAGVAGKTRFVRIPDPSKLKMRPIEVPGPGGPYQLIPQYYRDIMRILGPAAEEAPGAQLPPGAQIAAASNRATIDAALGRGAEGTGAGAGLVTDANRATVDAAMERAAGATKASEELVTAANRATTDAALARGVGAAGAGARITAASNLTRTINAAMEEWLVGKRSSMRMDAMAAHEPGITGIIMSMPAGKVNWKGISHDFSKYGPMDIVVSGRRFDNSVRDVIWQNLMEKYSDLPDVEAVRAVKSELSQIKGGRKPFAIWGSRWPIISPLARAPGRIWFEPRLNRMGDMGDYLLMTPMMMHSISADLDFDYAAISLAKHYGGTSAVADLITQGAEKAADPRVWEGTPEFMFATGQDVYGKGEMMEGYTEAITARVGGRIQTIKVPKIFRVKPIDKGVGYHIMTHKPKVDPVTGAHYVTNEMDIFRYYGEPVSFQPGEWVEVLEESIREGKAPSATDLALIRQLDPATRAEWVRSGRFQRAIRAAARSRADLYMGLVAQKGFIGHATSYAMALNLLAGEHLPQSEQAALSSSLGQWIQNVLSAKKWQSGEINRQLHRYGTFTRAVQNLRTLGDVFSDTLTAPEAKGGWDMPVDAVRSLARIPLSARRGYFPEAGLGYDLLHRAVQRQGVEQTVQQLMMVAGTQDLLQKSGLRTIQRLTMTGGGEAGNTIQDLLRKSGLGEVLSKFATEDTVAEPWSTRVPTGYFRRKPFIGPIFRRTRLHDTMLADATGVNAATAVKAGLVGGGIIGGLYLAFNFFRPNQSAVLGDMPGLGGEFWGPARGSRMELPRRMPIDVNEYTWPAPPYDRKSARIEMYNPVTAEKMALLPGRLQDALSPIVNWTVAPQDDIRYNNYNREVRPFTLQNAIVSSRAILMR